MRSDDPSVDADETLCWRAPRLPYDNWTIFDEGRGGHRWRGGAFVWNDDGVSCYRRVVLTTFGLDWSAVKIEPTNGILSVQVGAVRECDLGVAPDPDPSYIPSDPVATPR